MGTLWFNGNIYTMDHEGETVEAVFTQNGHIIDTGSLEKLKHTYRDSIQLEMDLSGKAMYPGFVDSHMHLIGFGETFIRLDLSRMRSKEEVLVAIATYAAHKKENEWIIGEGWNENNWTGSCTITKTDIDYVAPHHPVLLKRICRHAIVVNSRALEYACIDRHTKSPVGGKIEKDGSGEVTGVLKDNAQDLVFEVLPPIDTSYIKHALRKGIENSWKVGLVGAHTEDLSYYGSFQHTYAAFEKVIEEEKWRFRTHLLIHHKVIHEWKQVGHTFLSGSPFVEFGPMKIFVDGALGGRTALLSQPYDDDTTTIGIAVHSLPDLQNLVQTARNYKLPVAAHVIGDQAFSSILNIMSTIPPLKGQRDRLIHAQILRKDLIEKAKHLPVVIDIQPRFLATDFPWVMNRIGEERMAYSYAWRSLLQEGIKCAGGSDAPIEDANPLLGIHAAVTRTIPTDKRKTVYGKEQIISMYEAVSLFTTGSAYASYHENDRGKIKPHYTADFTVLDRDLFALEDVDELLETKVAMTVVAGEIMYVG